MNFKEKLSPSAQKKLSDLLFIFYAGGAALLSYSLVYALRKPFRYSGTWYPSLSESNLFLN